MDGRDFPGRWPGLGKLRAVGPARMVGYDFSVGRLLGRWPDPAVSRRPYHAIPLRPKGSQVYLAQAKGLGTGFNFSVRANGQRCEVFRSADFGEIGLRRSISPKSMRA